MTDSRGAFAWATIVAIGIWAAGVAPLRAQLVQQNAQPAAAGSRDASLEEYKAHLQSLETLTAACAKGRSLESCDPKPVGPDDRVPWGAKGERRLVRFGWLRALFARAQQPDEAAKAQGAARKAMEPGGDGAKADTLTTSQMLEDAQDRLADDLEQADGAAVGQPSHAAERAAVQQVLAGREFRRLKQPEQGPSALEKFNNWLNKLFEGLGKLQIHAAWVGRALIWGFLLAVGVGLVWALLQMERRWRIRLVPESEATAPAPASARDWQLWLKDAREAATRREWREAIHFLYWAAISRLESKKLWPADRARTPREYLALVAVDDPRKPGLGALTREFEVTWYGGRFAGEEDYQRAEELASGLFEGGAARMQGGAR